MKFNLKYLYGLLVIISVAVIFIVSQNSNEPVSPKEEKIVQNEMPDDEIHKGLTTPPGQNPGRDNVTETAKNKMERLKEAVEKNPDDTLKMREYADFLAAAHHQDEAIKYYNKILKINPNRTDILFNLSFIYFSAGDFKKSEELTNSILKIDKDNVKAIYNLGAIAANTGDFKRAKDLWNKIVNDYPDSETAGLAKSSLEKLSSAQ